MQLLTTMVLARLLQPADFGLMGMVLVVVGFVTVFNDLGTSAAVIREKNPSPSMWPSIFWTNVAFGVMSTMLLLMSSPLLGFFFKEPRVTPLLAVLSSSFLIYGFSVLHKAIMERDLLFDRLAKVELAATLVGATVGIGSAFLGCGVWSLVYQALALAMCTTLLLWVYSPWRPAFLFRWAEIKGIGNYSLNLVGYNILNYFVRNADNLLIGRFLGAEALGYYSLAYRLMLYPIQNIASVVGRVMFPVLSQIQDDDAAFRQVYLKAARSIALITFPLMTGVMALSAPFILTFFGEQWRPVILLLTILSPIGMAQSVGTTVGAIYQAKGRTDALFRWGLLSGAMALCAFVIGLQWGVVGVATAYAIAVALYAYPSFKIPFAFIQLRFRTFMAALWPPFLCSLLMGLVLFGVKQLAASLSDQAILALLVPLGIGVYGVASYWLNRESLEQLLGAVGVRFPRTKGHDVERYS